MTAAARQRSAGFTLIEVMVALALFALIAGAGFTMLDQVLRVQTLTEGRLERLAGMQRAMYLIADDLAHARPGTVRIVGDGTGDAALRSVSLGRAARALGGQPLMLRYRLEAGVFNRDLLQGGEVPLARQPLVTEVADVGWRFLDPAGAWLSDWPPPGTLLTADRPPANPRAMELRLVLAGGDELRRVALLPGEAR